MEPISEALKRGLSPSSARPSFEQILQSGRTLAPREMMQRRVDRYNAEAGTLHLADGYNCRRCNNRGYIAQLTETEDGRLYETYAPCACTPIRASIQRLKASGLETSIRQYTFDRFEAGAPWQQKMLDTARDYLANGVVDGRWLYLGGAVGSGKTHICTAVAGKLLYQMPVHYMTWPSESARLKAMINDEEEYGREMRRIKAVDALYIDDFFKPIQGDFGSLPPTAADVRLAYEIINHRYINRLITIISSERYLSELMDIDEATASRIAERATPRYTLSLARDRAKNHRLTAIEPI